MGRETVGSLQAKEREREREEEREKRERERERERKRERERERERESNPCPLLLFFQVLREGGVVGVVEGLAPKGRRLSPPEYLERGKEGEGRGERERPDRPDKKRQGQAR